MSEKQVYPLGLSGQDRIASTLGGGLPKGSVVLLEGDNGSGKSVWSQRFAYGLCEAGHTVSYTTSEYTTDTFIPQMRSLSYGMTSHLLSGRFTFLHADVDTHHLGGDRDDARELLSKHMDSELPWKSDVAIIDGLDSILLNDPVVDESLEDGTSDHVIQQFVSYLRRLTEIGKTIVITVNTENLDERAIRPLREVSDVYLQLSAKVVGSGVRKNVLVKRYSKLQSRVDDKIGFDVQSGVGIVIRTQMVT